MSYVIIWACMASILLMVTYHRVAAHPPTISTTTLTSSTVVDHRHCTFNVSGVSL